MQNPQLDSDANIEARTAQLQQIIRRQQKQIDELKLALDAQRGIEDQYRQVLDRMNEFAYSFRVEQDGTITREWRTQGFERITGYTSEEADARGGWLALIHPDDRLQAQDTLRLTLQGQQVTSTQRILNKRGAVYWVRTTNYPVWDENESRVVRFFGAGRDVTEEKTARLQQARFITNAMHELSHPVSSILLRLYLMRKQPERLEEHLNAIQPVADQLKRMIEDMREVSYLEQGIVFLQKQPFVLQDILNHVIEAQKAVAFSRQVTLNHLLPEMSIQVLVDPARIHQALTNLLNSSIHLMPEGENIQLDVYEEPIDHVPHAIIRLCHHRLLIEADHPTLIFRPFHRASEGHLTHTGLELMITREIMRLHGGDVDVVVDEDERAIFYIRLPLMT